MCFTKLHVIYMGYKRGVPLKGRPLYIWPPKVNLRQNRDWKLAIEASNFRNCAPQFRKLEASTSFFVSAFRFWEKKIGFN